MCVWQAGAEPAPCLVPLNAAPQEACSCTWQMRERGLQGTGLTNVLVCTVNRICAAKHPSEAAQSHANLRFLRSKTTQQGRKCDV
jgi:hypothetical protein